MMRVIILLILLGIGGYFVIQGQQQPQVHFNAIHDRLLHPLDHRLRYAIGSIDPRFGLSRAQVEQLAQEAADIWHTGLGEALFVYDPDARLKINLIYDARQAETEQRLQIKKHIAQQQQQHDLSQSHIATWRMKLAQDAQSIDRDVQQFNQDNRQYEQLVTAWNQSDRRHIEQQNMLHLQRATLQRQQQQLQQKIQTYQDQLNEFNQYVQQSNLDTEQFNQRLDSFNAELRPRQFDKGVFNGREINIYEFQSIDDLRITLAHELGHGLKIAHHQDEKGLMYPVMKMQTLDHFQLQPSDIALFKSR